MTFDDYQQEVSKTAIPLTRRHDKEMKGALGLASEAGEIAGLLEKVYYQNHQLHPDKLKKELGDVLWYLTYLIDTYGWTLEEIAALNVAKLRDRYRSGHFSGVDSIARKDVTDA